MDALLKIIHRSTSLTYIRKAILGQAKVVPGLTKLRMKKIRGACKHRLKYLRRGGMVS